MIDSERIIRNVVSNPNGGFTLSFDNDKYFLAVPYGGGLVATSLKFHNGFDAKTIIGSMFVSIERSKLSFGCVLGTDVPVQAQEYYLNLDFPFQVIKFSVITHGTECCVTSLLTDTNLSKRYGSFFFSRRLESDTGIFSDTGFISNTEINSDSGFSSNLDNDSCTGSTTPSVTTPQFIDFTWHRSVKEVTRSVMSLM